MCNTEPAFGIKQILQVWDTEAHVRQQQQLVHVLEVADNQQLSPLFHETSRSEDARTVYSQFKPVRLYSTTSLECTEEQHLYHGLVQSAALISVPTVDTRIAKSNLKQWSCECSCIFYMPYFLTLLYPVAFQFRRSVHVEHGISKRKQKL